MPDAALDVPDAAAGITLVPGSIELLGDSPELHEAIAGKVVWLAFPRFSRQRRSRAASSLPMMIRASVPPTKVRLSMESGNLKFCRFIVSSRHRAGVNNFY